MFHSRGPNNKINRLRERCLRIVYSNKKSSFERLLDKNKSISVYVKNVPTFAPGKCKVAKKRKYTK